MSLWLRLYACYHLCNYVYCISLYAPLLQAARLEHQVHVVSTSLLATTYCCAIAELVFTDILTKHIRPGKYMKSCNYDVTVTTYLAYNINIKVVVFCALSLDLL
uniref:Very-long-chain 3-oxoacyl-CoA synthase n=1 Tax=Heterorhabditis bacteriophora TaxID=37862 RepID=A0A1I7X5Q5_HETBA